MDVDERNLQVMGLERYILTSSNHSHSHGVESGRSKVFGLQCTVFGF